MEQAIRIINALTRIAERADMFRHGREELFGDINLTEIHCIHWIGTLDHANVTKIAGAMGMTRGAISKISRKLVSKGLLGTYQEPHNNKEIYFRLTETGQRLYDVHKQCHTRARKEKLAVLQGYDRDAQAVILRFLDDMNGLIDRRLAASEACPGEDASGGRGA